MLPRIARLQPASSGRLRWSLVCCSLAIFALPTWTQQARSQFGGGVKSEKKATEKPAEPKSTEPKPGESKSADPNPVEPKAANPNGADGFIQNLQAKIPLDGVRRPPLPPMAPPSVEFLPEPSDTEQTILNTLDEKVEFDFADESLKGVAEYLLERYKLQIVMDKIKLEEESIAIDATDITAKVSGISLRSGLNILFKPKNLAFIIDDEVIKVTTRTDAVLHLVTRTYPVRDLVGNVDVDYRLLMAAIQQATGDPGKGVQWIDIDGEGGTISILPATGCLVIRATMETHQEVMKLLRSLRTANAEVRVK